MKFIAKGLTVMHGMRGYQLLMPAPKTPDLNNIKDDVEYEVTIKVKRHKRSLNANSYCWLLCQRIAETLSRDGQYISKEEIYREAIQDSQGFTPVCVQAGKADAVCRDWQSHGIGWIAVNTGTSKIAKCSVLHLYAGSSVYDTADMSRLIDCLVDEAKQIGVPLEDAAYIKDLLDDWRPQDE